MSVRTTTHTDALARRRAQASRRSSDLFAKARSRARCEQGFSLIELLTVLPMVAIVLLGMSALYNVSARGHQRSDARVRSLTQQQRGLERLSREMRQATAVTPVSSSVLDATTWVRPADGSAAVKRHVRYDCSTGNSCRRYEGPAGGTTYDVGPVTVISGVLNTDAFTLQPDDVNPSYVTTRVQVSVKDAQNPITLQGGFALRNLAVPADDLDGIDEHQNEGNGV